MDVSYISQSVWTGDIWFHPRFMYNICILLPFLAAISAILAIVNAACDGPMTITVFIIAANTVTQSATVSVLLLALLTVMLGRHDFKHYTGFIS